MKQLIPLLLGLLLSGCYSDQKQQLSMCELKEHARTADQVQDLPASDYVALCMRAQGYEIVEDDCPAFMRTNLIPKPDPEFYDSLSENQKNRLNMETGTKIMNMEAMQKIDPACYEPMGWFDKRILRLEKWFGASS
jgi:hypothetical protein